MKKLILTLLISFNSYGVCDINGNPIINELANMKGPNHNSSLLDSVISTTREQKTVLIDKRERLRELLELRDSDPVEVYRLQKEIEFEEIEAQRARAQRQLEENPNLLDDIVQRTNNTDNVLVDVIRDDQIDIPRDVQNRMRRDGLSLTDIAATKLYPGDTHQLWLPGGNYAAAKVIGPGDLDGFVKVEYLEDGVLKTSDKPISYLVLSPSQRKEMIDSYRSAGETMLDQVVQQTQRSKSGAKELVDQAIAKVLEAPGADAIKEEMEVIYRTQGVMGIASKRYLDLSDELKRVQYPYDPLTKDEIEGVFSPLEVLLNKEIHGAKDKALIAKAKSILDSKKRHYSQDEGHRDLLNAAIDAPLHLRTKRRTNTRRLILSQSNSSSFTYYRPPFDERVLSNDFSRVSRHEAERLIETMSKEPGDITPRELTEIRTFIRNVENSRDRNKDSVKYFFERAKLYNDFHK